MTHDFGPVQREQFRVMVRSAPLDERRAADEAQRLSTEWFGALPAVLDVDLARVLVHKVAGYNADMHQHTRRALRAAGAADQWLSRIGPDDAIDFSCDDLLLGEYFLIQRARSRGRRVVTRRPWDELVAGLVAAWPARSATPGFEALEAPISEGSAQATRRPRPPIATLFVATMNNYLNPMIPVMERLVKDGRRVGILLPKESAGWSNIKRLPAWTERITLEELMDPDLVELLEGERRRWSVAWAERSRAVSCRFACDGLDLWPLVARDIEHVATVYIPNTILHAEMARRLCERRHVRVLVCARLRRAVECAFAGVAQSCGARTVMLMHGHVSSDPQRRFDDGSFHWADAVCVWGKYHQGLLADKRENIEPARVHPTGNPDWDRLAGTDRSMDARARVRARVACELSVDPRSVLVTVTTQADSSPQFPAIARAVLAAPDAALIVKIHPREDAGAYRALIPPGTESRVRFVKDAPALHDILLACDATVTFHSTTNIESLLLGTPVITAAIGTLAQADRLVPLERFGLPLATTEDALRDIMESVARDPERFRHACRLAMTRALSELVTNYDPAVSATSSVCLLIRNLESEAA